MAQLAELQEQYENELAKVREDHDAALEAQQDALLQLREDRRGRRQLDALQALRDENGRLQQRLEQLATKQDVQALQLQLRALESDGRDEQARVRADLNGLDDRLGQLDGRLAHADRGLADVDRKVAELAEMPAPSPSPSRAPMPMPPRDLVRVKDLDEIHDALRRTTRDFAAVAADMAALSKRLEAQGTRQETRLQELNTHVMDALGRDSRMHATEISRLKDALFDAQSAHREFGQKVRRLEDELQQVMTTRVPPRSPPRDRGGGPGWRYGQSQPPLLPLPQPPQPPPASAFRSRRERPSRYEPAPDYRDNAAPRYEPPPQDRIRWAPRRNSRSRSRSPPRRSPWSNATNGLPHTDSRSVAPEQRGRPFQHPDQRSNAQHNYGGGAPSTGNEVTEVDVLPSSLSTESTQISRAESRPTGDEEQSNMPSRRSRQSRRTPEIIVIEEDDDDDDGDNAEDEEDEEEAEEEGEVSPSRAPPDVVLDEEEATQPADANRAPPPGSANASHAEPTDLLEKEADLQTGLLLYFCLGGAPDLDIQWTNCFSQLNADECVEMPRVLHFQRRYSVLQNFPVYLTQCILQAVILNDHNSPEGCNPETAQLAGALNASSVSAKFGEVVKGIHQSWAEALIEYLSKQAGSMVNFTAENFELSINPAVLSSEADKDDIIYDWSRRQESAMWFLAQKLHYGSILPAMKCNVDASPAVYLFILMFDVLTVTSECPQYGTFRLNEFGGKLMAHLWDRTLRKLPYAFFADWSWLDDQSTKEKLPALAFCHLLASILLWNSAIDRHSLTNRNIYADAVKHIVPKLHVEGKPVCNSLDATESTPLLLAECKSTQIEMLDLDTKFASMLGLDGFFEVTEAIQNNMLSATAAACPASS
ncbi:unnamed protein product [Phytophthora fragariaefolia]|uniref:Unnamed protein product n=1 Tax=Phytophthora fragariaefolia TaxID=1490495 RepID=A0A9W6WT19_9STRA|nr:unnamed protein product [Phytophthora fragariaefolia]